MNKYKKAFTLAETLIALTVLAIIAMIVVHPVIKKHQDMVGRMKAKLDFT